MMIHFVVPCVPVAQPRQRHRVIAAHGKTFAQNYTPKNDPVNGFKSSVQAAAFAAYSGPPLDCPLSMDLIFVFPRPASVRKKDGFGRLPHTVKPDRDNVMKAVQDALNGLTYRDDSLICAGSVEKWRAAADEQPHVEVTIRAL
jgi:Holliday junction resolvase RusA-like endonuclease